jgi:hypothetical protein
MVVLFLGHIFDHNGPRLTGSEIRTMKCKGFEGLPKAKYFIAILPIF